MPQIDSHPEFRARLGRNVHNLSHDLTITCTTGHLLPVFFDYLNPGESVKIAAPFELRTMPMQAAAMVNIRCHMEYFFVPMQLLYSAFGNTFYGVTDNFSSLYPVQGVIKNTLPLVDVGYIFGYARTRGNNIYTGERCWQSMYRLADLLQYDLQDFWSNGTSGASVFNPIVFPANYLAYNAIYQHYYRLDTRETFKNRLFNVDWLYNQGTAGPNQLSTNVFDLKCRPMSDDYFTSAKVSPIVDALNVSGGIPFGSDQRVSSDWLSRGSTQNGDILKSGSRGDNSVIYDGSPTNVDYSPYEDSGKFFANFGFAAYNQETSENGLDINTANIRAMFANEKYYSILGRAKKNYDDQTLAHFGVKVPKDIKHDISFFGHDVLPIKIGEVISTSGTESTSLGEIAGKGYAYANKNFHTFKAPVHGVVMCIFSVVPEIKYSKHGCSRINWLRDANDFYRPEFDNLGMQPIFNQEVGIGAAGSTQYAARILGWQYRYEQYKRRFNRTTTIFNEYNMLNPSTVINGNLSSWSVSRQPYNGYYHSPSHDVFTPNAESYSLFVHQPDDLDSVMLVAYNKQIDQPVNFEVDRGDAYLYDPFVVDFHFDIKKLSSMSDKSLPKLID